jgi:hypothetical protein
LSTPIRGHRTRIALVVATLSLVASASGTRLDQAEQMATNTARGGTD